MAVVERAPTLHSSGFNEVFWDCSGLDALVFAVKSPPFVDLIIPLVFFLHILVLQNIEAEQYTSTSERNEGASRKTFDDWPSLEMKKAERVGRLLPYLASYHAVQEVSRKP